MNAIRLSLVAAVALMLTACGGAKLGGGKEGAAEALFQASGPAGSSKGAIARAQASGATTGEVKVDGQKSGSATLTFDISDTDAQSGFVSWKIKYDNFSDDGKNFYSGDMAMKIKFDFNITNTTASGSMVIVMKGRMNISGEISDFLEADITETLDFSSLSNTDGAAAGSISIKLNGTIKTSTETHTYANETITFTADGSLPAAEG